MNVTRSSSRPIVATEGEDSHSHHHPWCHRHVSCWESTVQSTSYEQCHRPHLTGRRPPAGSTPEASEIGPPLSCQLLLGAESSRAWLPCFLCGKTTWATVTQPPLRSADGVAATPKAEKANLYLQKCVRMETDMPPRQREGPAYSTTRPGNCTCSDEVTVSAKAILD